MKGSLSAMAMLRGSRRSPQRIASSVAVQVMTTSRHITVKNTY